MDEQQYTQAYTYRYSSSGLVMADSPQYQPTPKAQDILDVLRAADGWIGRSELAKRLHKNALNKWDVVLLSKLEVAGLIEMRQIPHHGPIGYEWQYRALSNNQN